MKNLFTSCAFSIFILVTLVPVKARTEVTTPSLCSRSTETTLIETLDKRRGRSWVTPIQPFCPEDYLEATSASLPRLNQLVVACLLRFPRQGQHRYLWPRRNEVVYDGATTHVVFAGKTVLRGEPQGRCYCCGLTLEVFYRVLDSLGIVPERFHQVGPSRLKELWFCRDIFSPGPSEALEALGMGQRVSPEAALPGDFVQLWRHNRSGHSVIFVAWALNPQGERVGIHYWSTQEATNGIGFAAEALGSEGPFVWLDKCGFVRLLPPERQP